VSADRRQEAKSAAADYAASWVEGRWSVRWWKTAESFPLSRAADLLDGSAEWLRGLVEHPVADAASRAGVEGPIVPIGSGITANFVTVRLTAPLEGAARVCEVAGIVLGMATGMHPLVLACAKRLAHDELGKVLSRGFEQIIDSPGTGRERTADANRGTDTVTRDGYRGRLSRGSPDAVREPDQARGRPGRNDSPGRDGYRGRLSRGSPDAVREPDQARGGQAVMTVQAVTAIQTAAVANGADCVRKPTRPSAFEVVRTAPGPLTCAGGSFR
jgi:hypothetical protein